MSLPDFQPDGCNYVVLFGNDFSVCAVFSAHSDVMTIDGRVCDYVIFDLDCPQLERSFWISWHKGDTSLQHWMRGKTGHGQRIRVFPNGTLGLHVVEKEDAGWYTAMMCNSSQHCLCQRKFQLRVHGGCKFSL